MSWRDQTWAIVDGLELQARIYPAAATAAGTGAPAPALIDIHGGAWSSGDRTTGALYCEHLAAAGFCIIAIDFRQAPAHRHPSASCDAVAAVRWLRLNADALRVDAKRIGLIGSSSGGHLALLAATRHAAEAHRGTWIVGPDGRTATHDEIAANVAYVIALWPVSDPFHRYRYARRAGIQRLVSAHESYYQDEAAMREASVPRLVTAGEAQALPPALIVQPGEDGNVPIEMTFELLRAWQSRGGAIEYAFYPEMPHAFGHRPGAATDDMLRLITDFARRQLVRN